jgi:hypothetical protein
MWTKILGYFGRLEKSKRWLQHDSGAPVIDYKEDSLAPLKNKEIEILSDYTKNPGPSFWNLFPNMDMPKKPSTSVNANELEFLLEKNKAKLLTHQLERGKKCVKNLRGQAHAKCNHL